MTNAVINNKEEFTLKEKILYTAGSILVAAGTFLIGRKIVRSAVSNQEEKKTLSEDAPATYAKRIKMAFENDGWPGTDTVSLRTVLRAIPSKHSMSQVASSYQKLYNSSIYRDMSGELQTTEYNEMLSIINAKPDRIGKKGELLVLSAKNYSEWAKRLKAAFDKSYGPLPGTDEEAIVAVFQEIPTQADFVLVGLQYKDLYGTNMIDDLKGESEGAEYSDWMKIITSKPQK